MVAQVFHRLTGREPPGDLDDLVLAHAEDHEVGLGVEHDRPADGVAPVIVVSQPPERCLDAAGDDRHAGKGLAGTLTVRHRRPVGTQADPAARTVGIVVADLLVGRVVVDHAVHVAGADAEEQPRPAELPPGLGAAPVGLAENRDPEAGRLEHPAQDAHRERRVIDVGVARHEDDVHIVPAPRLHLRSGRRQMRQRKRNDRQHGKLRGRCVRVNAARRAGGWSNHVLSH